MCVGIADRAELYLYADKGYIDGKGATLLTSYKGRNLPDSTREANPCHIMIRASAERGFAVLKSWKIFDRFRGCPRRVGAFTQAVPIWSMAPSKGTWKKLGVGEGVKPPAIDVENVSCALGWSVPGAR